MGDQPRIGRDHRTARFLEWLRGEEVRPPSELDHDTASGIGPHMQAFREAPLQQQLAHLESHVKTEGDRTYLAHIERSSFDVSLQHTAWHVHQRHIPLGPPEGS